MNRDVLLEALGALCNTTVTSFQKQGSPAQQQQLFIRHFIPTVLDADETCQASTFNFLSMRNILQSLTLGLFSAESAPTGGNFIIDEDEFFDPQFDYDFRGLKDTETYYRGGEVYERPCGWNRFALKVLDKYDGNAWLGSQDRSTKSVRGEWPVSYHGTSEKGAEAIIEGFYKPGPRQVYGRGVYSTPYMAEAVPYTKTFTSKKDGKRYQVVLQNRINPKYREKHNNDKYWLVRIPAGKSDAEEQEMVERAIRPYGLLLKEV